MAITLYGGVWLEQDNATKTFKWSRQDMVPQRVTGTADRIFSAALSHGSTFVPHHKRKAVEKELAKWMKEVPDWTVIDDAKVTQ